MFLPHPRVKVSIVGSLRDREVACSASDRQGLNFEFCVWRTVSSQSSHHPQEVLLAQFSLYVHKGGLKPDSFHLLLIKYQCLRFFFSHRPVDIHNVFNQEQVQLLMKQGELEDVPVFDSLFREDDVNKIPILIFQPMQFYLKINIT